MTRTVTNDDVKKYKPMVEKFLRDSVQKNWSESQIKTPNQEIALGNTGMSLSDFRQYLYTEVVVALQKYRPDFTTKDGKTVKESTFVFCCLNSRIGQTLKRLCKPRFGYGVWTSSIDDILEGHKNND